MLEAVPDRVRFDYEILVAGRPVGRWQGRAWTDTGTVTLEGQTYTLRGDDGQFSLFDGDGNFVVTADRRRRREWRLVSRDEIFVFRRPRWWRQRYDLVRGGEVAGWVRQRGVWKPVVEASLPELPLVAQVFAVAVVLCTWEGELLWLTLGTSALPW
jgi:hypothetical protein